MQAVYDVLIKYLPIIGIPTLIAFASAVFKVIALIDTPKIVRLFYPAQKNIMISSIKLFLTNIAISLFSVYLFILFYRNSTLLEILVLFLFCFVVYFVVLINVQNAKSLFGKKIEFEVKMTVGSSLISEVLLIKEVTPDGEVLLEDSNGSYFFSDVATVKKHKISKR